MPGHHNPRRILLVAAATMAVDWFTKWYAVTNWGDNPVDLGWIMLVDRRNEGIAFSLGNNLPVWAVLLITGTIVIALSVMALRGHFRPSVGAGLIVGGGLGNLLDRLVNGAVIDMFDLGWWPVFNVADVALNVGVGLILLWALTQPLPEELDENEVTAPR